jgi:hypothetical protein
VEFLLHFHSPHFYVASKNIGKISYLFNHHNKSLIISKEGKKLAKKSIKEIILFMYKKDRHEMMMVVRASE